MGLKGRSYEKCRKLDHDKLLIIEEQSLRTRDKMSRLSQRILFLTLKTFSFTGGIEKACRSLIYAIHQGGKHRLITWSMYDRDADLDQRYTIKQHFKGFRGKQFLFALAIKAKAFSFDKVILSHINLLLFGKIIKSLKPST